MNDRRTFLKQVSVAGATGVVAIGTRPQMVFARASSSAKADPDGRILVLVQLAGGNDGLNTVVPFDNDEYRRLRPSLAISRKAVLKLDDTIGLHPRLAPLKKMFDEGVLGVVQGVGYPKPNRSHFRSMDIWQTARTDGEDKRDGWLGRAFDASEEELAGTVPAVALGTGRLPLSLVSTKFTVPTVRNLGDYQLQLEGSKAEQASHRAHMRELVGGETSGDNNLAFLRRTAASALDTSAKISDVLSEYKPAKPYPENKLAQSLKSVAQLITADLGARVYFVSLGGFDTHSDQEGAHAALMGELSTALAAFQADLKGHDLGGRVLTATFSEFGRRVKENGSLGTDHGTAGPMFIVGDAAKGGLHGKHPSLTDLMQGDLRHHTDFRSVYSTLLNDWLGWDAETALGGKFSRPALLA